MLRAVAQLTSVGFEGGALRLNQNPGSTRGIINFVFGIPDRLMANWKLYIIYFYLRSAGLGNELQHVVHMAMCTR